MKPLVRWTVGNPCQKGWSCLNLSIRNFKKLYGDEFDYCVCYNGQKPNVDIDLVNQRDYISSLSIPPNSSPAWKLYPPRLRIDAPEIFVDNDLVLHKRIDFDFTKISVSEDPAYFRCYGQFDHYVPAEVHINTGLFVLPPGFDLKPEIELEIKEWQEHCDEQGLLAFIFCKYGCKLFRGITVCTPEAPYRLAEFGMHFVCLNSGFDNHYDQYISHLVQM